MLARSIGGLGDLGTGTCSGLAHEQRPYCQAATAATTSTAATGSATTTATRDSSTAAAAPDSTASTAAASTAAASGKLYTCFRNVGVFLVEDIERRQTHTGESPLAGGNGSRRARIVCQYVCWRSSCCRGGCHRQRHPGSADSW